MLRFILYLLLIHCTSLFCECTEKHTFSKPVTKKYKKPTPKIICEATGNYFSVFGGYLYYIPNTDGLGYAITGIDNSTDANMLDLNKGLYLSPKQNASSGFRVGVTAQLGLDKMQIQGDFSNWKNHNLYKNKGEGDCSSSLFNGTYYNNADNVALWNSQINTVFNGTQSPLPLTYSYVDWTQQLSLSNIAIKADKLIGESFIIRPQIGALYAFSKENYNIHYNFDYNTIATLDDMTKAKICSSQVSHSIGPKIGITSLFYPMQELALFGEFFCTPAANRFIMNTRECADFLVDTSPITTAEIEIFNVEHRNYSITPILELSLGIEGDLHLFKTQSKLIIAFDQKYLFSRNYIKPPDFNTLYTPTNFSIQGLRASASVLPFSEDQDEACSLDKTKSFLQPKFRRPTNKVGLSLEGEFLYPKPRVEGLAYAISGINYIGVDPSVATNLDCISKGKVYAPEFIRGFAYRAELNAHLKYAALDFGAELFIMPRIEVATPVTKFSSTITQDEIFHQAQPLWFQDFSSTNFQGLFAMSIAGTSLIQEASSKYSLQLRRINGYHSNTFWLKDFLTMQIKYGLAYLKQEQHYDINYTYTLVSALNLSVDVHNSQSLQALGLSFKCKSSFFLAKFLAFYGSLELSAPYGQLQVDTNAIVSSTNATTNYWTFTNKIKQIFPFFVGEGGVELMLWGKEDTNLLHFGVGYNIAAFLSNNFMQPVTNADAEIPTQLTNGGYMNNSKGTLGLSGIVFRLGLKF